MALGRESGRGDQPELLPRRIPGSQRRGIVHLQCRSHGVQGGVQPLECEGMGWTGVELDGRRSGHFGIPGTCGPQQPRPNCHFPSGSRVPLLAATGGRIERGEECSRTLRQQRRLQHQRELPGRGGLAGGKEGRRTDCEWRIRGMHRVACQQHSQRWDAVLPHGQPLPGQPQHMDLLLQPREQHLLGQHRADQQQHLWRGAFGGRRGVRCGIDRIEQHPTQQLGCGIRRLGRFRCHARQRHRHPPSVGRREEDMLRGRQPVHQFHRRRRSLVD